MNRFVYDPNAVGILAAQLRDTTKWTPEQQDATVAQFRKLIHESDLDDAVKLAMHAGKKMAKLLASVGNTVCNLSESQIDEYRRKFGVQRSRVNVMLMVAWSHLYYPPKPLPRDTKTIGAAQPRTAAKQMIKQYGFLAEKMTRKMMRGGSVENNQYWKDVARCVREQQLCLQCSKRRRTDNTNYCGTCLPEVRRLGLGRAA